MGGHNNDGYLPDTHETSECSVKTISISTISKEYNHQKARHETESRLPYESNKSPKDNLCYQDYDRGRNEAVKEVKPKMVTQVFCALAISLTQVGSGAIFSFSGVTLPQMTQPDSTDIYLSPTYAALFGSLMTIGAAFGGLCCGPVVERVGHCKTIQLALPILLAFWLTLAFSPNELIAVASRTGMGLMIGVINPSSSAYILEIAHKEQRGILVAALPTAKQLGFLIVAILGVLPLTWRHMALICGALTTVLPFIGIFFFPRSPRWLVAHGKDEEAAKSLIFFRGEDYDWQSELKDIVKEVRKGKVHSMSTQCKQLFQGPVLKPMLILLFLCAFGNFHGSHAISSYLVMIFQNSSLMDAYTSAILVGLVRVIGTLCYLVLIDKAGRRPLHILSYFAISALLAILGGYFYFVNLGLVGSDLDWLQITALLSYTFFISLGLPVLTILQGELLPNSVRPIGMSLLTFVMFLTGFISAQIYFDMQTALGTHGTFWIYSAGCLVVAIISHFTLPETNGQSLEDISKGKPKAKGPPEKVVG